MARRGTSEINAGSMADIAFLLLIFFLVTTTMDQDTGIQVQLPPSELPKDPPDIPERNLFEIVVNANNDMLVEDEYMEIEDLREAAKAFIDNNGEGSCTYCNGNQDPKSSDKPNEAILSIALDNSTTYDMYITIRNELNAAYRELREDLSQTLYGKPYKDLSEDERKDIEAKYPLVISEPKPLQS